MRPAPPAARHGQREVSNRYREASQGLRDVGLRDLWGLGFRVVGLRGFRVKDFGFGVLGPRGFRVMDFGFMV